MIDYESNEEWDSGNPILGGIPATQPVCNDGDEGAAGDTIDGADLLDRVHSYLKRFILYPSSTAGAAHTLWIAHAHMMEAWFSTPRLAILSAEPASGKSRVLEMTAILVPRPLLSAASTSAFIMRSIADQENRPTVLYDEIDAIFGPRGKGNEDLRAMINAGYRRGMTIGRCYTDKGKVFTEQLQTFAPVVMGGLGDLPDTLMSRSVVIRMRRRALGEMVEPFQPSLHEAAGQALCDELANWAAIVSAQAAAAVPTLPGEVRDRDADVWGPLLTVADLAGRGWPEVGRKAAIEFVRGAKDDELPLNVQLLVDLRRCFGNEDRLSTSELLDRLLADDEAPWGDLQGGRLNPRKLAKMLRQFSIKSKTVRIGNETPKGYVREDLHDAWRRYLPPPQLPATSATTATANEEAQLLGPSDVADDVLLRDEDGRGGNVVERES